jgi:formylglycine-generating enzyme required for sulfatase activity
MGGTFYPLVTTTVSSYYLDEYEVTTGRFRAFLANFDAWRAAGNPMNGAGAHPLIADSGWQSHWNVYLSARESDLWNDSSLCFMRNWDFADDNEPVNCVTWYEAFAFCLWDQSRLPTSPEWEYAAIGGSLSRAYPWGSAPMDPQVNCNYECMGDGFTDCTTADILPVGSRPSGAGLWGQQDLLGSMAEWVLDLSGPYPSPCVDCANVTGGTFRTMRGGGWSDPAGYVTSIRRDYQYEPDAGETTPAVRWNFLGLRCAHSLPGAGAGEP